MKLCKGSNDTDSTSYEKTLIFLKEIVVKLVLQQKIADFS